MPSITQQTIRAIKPTGSIQYIRDSELRGFAIKVSAKGQVSFVVEGRIKGGTTFRIVLGTDETLTLNDAKPEAMQIMATAKRGIDPRYSRPVSNLATQTLRWCLEKHFEADGVRESTEKTYRNQMNNVFKDWYKEPVDQITPERIIDRRKKLLKEGKSENYVASCLRTLKAVLNNSDLPLNPVSVAGKRGKFSVQSMPTEKEEFLRDDKIAALLHAYADSSNYGDGEYARDGTWLGEPPKPNIFAAALYLLLIGGREQDVYNLRWDMVDQHYKIITYPPRTRKQKRSYKIPMVGMIEDIITQQPIHLRHPDLVFGMSHSMFTARYDAHIKPITQHSSKSLRKTFGEHMGLDGYDDKAIGRALDHSHAVAGNVTTKSYFKGNLMNERLFKEMFTSIQARYLHYAFGHTHDDTISNDLLADLGSSGKGIEGLNTMTPQQYKMHNLLSNFPTFRASLKTKTTEDIREEMELIELLAAQYTH